MKFFVGCELPVPELNPFQCSVEIQETKHGHSSSIQKKKISVNHIYIFKCNIEERTLNSTYTMHTLKPWTHSQYG